MSRLLGAVIVLHAAWTSASRLCLWGETPTAARRSPQRSAPPLHPHSSSPSRLRETLGRLDLPAGLLDGARDGQLTVALPTQAGAPLLSVQSRPPGRGARGRPALQPWRVRTLELKPSAAIDLLLAAPSGSGAGLAVGQSVRFFARVVELALELAAAGRVLPELVAEGSGYAARWRPVPRQEDLARLGALVDAMPPVCRAEVTSDRAEGRAGREVLEGLVEAVIDAAVRDTVARRPAPSGLRETGSPTVDAWLRALAAPDATVKEDRAALARLHQALEVWRRGGLVAPGPVRTCFRLCEPPGDHASDRWHVEFFLQKADEPSLLISASEVWRSGQRLGLLQDLVDSPQERLLEDLGRATRLWPDLEGGLNAAKPVGVDLDARAAHHFLSESAGLLMQAGFGVLLPAWWNRREVQLGARLKVSLKDGGVATGTGLVGLEGLCDYRWELALGDERLSLEELRELAALQTPLVKVRGRWLELKPEVLGAALAFFERAEVDGHGEASAAALMRTGLGLSPSETGLPVVGFEADGWLGALLREDSDLALEPVPTPPGFGGRLRPYQERGLAWLRFFSELGLGACLADDMGLGKTVQLLALLASERAQGERLGPTLLVCPMSVVGNWQREAERFARFLSVHIHHGSERLAGEELLEAVTKSDLVITTYALVTRDRETLGQVRWERVVLDEAQNVKNSAAKQSQAVRSLPAVRRAALTGTPVENRLSELWSIMDFCNPGLLGPASDFRRRFAVPIERYRDDAAAATLTRLVGPFILRRLKTDRAIIVDLPEKVEMKVFCNITREQATLYQAVLDDMLAKIEQSEGIARRGLVLATMTRLKQVLNHPAHLLGDGSRLDGRSGKLARLEEILEEALAEGDRALCFTQFAEMGLLLKPHLEERFGGEVPFLHGGTPKAARDEIVARFQADAGPSVLLLSLKAGGTGLNLTAANHVIHFDRWWNPAVEDQATDRAFRIGQRKDVQVRKLICVGTLDERIDRMIEDKKDLAQRIVGSGEGWLTELSTAELRKVVALSADAVVE